LGPLVVAMLGAGGAVALEGLRPKAGPLLVVSALAIGVSFWLSLRARRARPSCQSPIGALTILGLALGAGLGRAHGAALGKIRMKPIAALFILCSVLVACAARASSNTMQYVTLNSANQPFRDAFNRHRDDVRIVELVSPTCPACLDGVSKIQRVLFSTEPSRRLAGFTIWVPMLGGKAGNVPDAMTLAPDPRVAHYWDESNDLGIAYERVLPVSTGPAWDVYLIYAPGIVWNGADPPKSSFWMHQLAIANAPHLDVALFADRARAMFAHAH
jgi:hypothetical protein